MRNISYAANRQDIRISAETPSLFSPVIGSFKAFTTMQNANHGARRPSSTVSDLKGGGKTFWRDEIMEIHSQALEMIEILERMSTILEAIERGSKERYDAADPRASAIEARDPTRSI
ncbi:hypothetical protein PAAG_12632 [Paracoccidioides lutzii Pb01]|uniref:Uncharacterized protein n=1 Tax=Paracoccidioides lutzii (strain ATCC MYA-826 / Pb01) TaxID=502779 RepID=A0A0A2VIH8_PARBA|nr:hypothetical protein PAAG_12632 [Paracoccidioides lutzii Pb01]KGQ00699.1 hypothetical protein PAAG_12632 [Paracoccidioides lutzii Pb01]